jgi:subtilisin family serine protease
MMYLKKVTALMLVTILITITFVDPVNSDTTMHPKPDLSSFPSVSSYNPLAEEKPWWETTSLDYDRNHIFDNLDNKILTNGDAEVDIFLDYDHPTSLEDAAILEDMGLDVVYLLPDAQAIALRNVPISLLDTLTEIEGVVMVEPQIEAEYFSHIATPSVKAKGSEEYSPYTAWELDYTGKGAVIAIMDTGVDNGHPSLSGKWVGGADFSKPPTILTPQDGSYDADDVQGHGTTCAGIAMGTGAPEEEYQGTSPDAKLVDLRIGTILGGSPGEGPISVYDAAILATEWAIEHHADQWPGESEDYYGIDVLSLSWGIPYEGSSDGSELWQLLQLETTDPIMMDLQGWEPQTR